MPGSAKQQRELAQALETAKKRKWDDVDPATKQVLQDADRRLYNYLGDHPDYILSPDEFSLLTMFSWKYENNSVTKRAIGKFWTHYPDGSAGPSSSKSGPK